MQTLLRLATLGTLAILLTFGCKQDDYSPPDQKPLEVITPDKAIELFTKNYKAGDDEFSDRVMQGLLAMNDSTPILQALVQKHGVPLWDRDRTLPVKTGNLLMIPVQGSHPDSLSLLTFIEKDSMIYYKIFEPVTNDTLVSDYLLLHKILINPNGDYSHRFIKQKGGNGKEGWSIETCWDVYYLGNDGNFHWSYSWCKSNYFSHFEAEIAEDNIVNSGWGDITSGGTSGPDVPPSSSNPLPKTNPKIEEIRKELLKSCASITILNAVWENVTFFINTALGVWDARYNPSTGNVTFNGNGSVNTANLLHELFHAYQHHLLGSLPKQGETGYVNLEFEAHLFVDLWARGRIAGYESWLENRRDVPLKQIREYYEWLNQISKNPNVIKNSGEYMKWLNKFSDYMPQYRSPINSNSQNIPNQIIDVLKKCNLIQN